MSKELIKILVPASEKGRYRVLHTRSTDPDKNGNVEVLLDNGKTESVPAKSIKPYKFKECESKYLNTETIRRKK